MTSSAGTHGQFKIAATGSTEVEVADIRSYSFDTTADALESTVMGDDYRQFLQGLATSTLSIETYFNADNHVAFEERAIVDWELYPTGTGAGEVYFSGTGIVTGRTISAAFDGMLEASFSIQNTGAPTRATV